MSFNIWTFLFEIVNFVVLAYVLHRLLYRPLRAAIDNRRAAIVAAQHDAAKSRADAVALQKQVQSQLADIENERQEAVKKTRELAEAERHKLLAEGQKAVDRLKEEARVAIERQRADALRSLQAKLNSSAAELAERLLQESVGSSLQQQLAQRLVDTLSQLPEKQRLQVRSDWSEADGAVVETATTLDRGSLEQINKAASALAGQTVTLAVQVQPALLAGARLRIGGHVWDASLAGQFEALRSDHTGGPAHV